MHSRNPRGSMANGMAECRDGRGRAARRSREPFASARDLSPTPAEQMADGVLAESTHQRYRRIQGDRDGEESGGSKARSHIRSVFPVNEISLLNIKVSWLAAGISAADKARFSTVSQLCNDFHSPMKTSNADSFSSSTETVKSWSLTTVGLFCCVEKNCDSTINPNTTEVVGC